jgi:dCTP deaminase
MRLGIPGDEIFDYIALSVSIPPALDNTSRSRSSLILCDHDLQHYLKRGWLECEPLTDPETQIQPSSIDLRLGNTFRWFQEDEQPELFDTRTDDAERQMISLTAFEGGFELFPGDFVLASTLERVKIPNDLVGRVDGRSSLARLGLVIESAGWIDPGFFGEITLELFNQGPRVLRLYPGDRICQISFSQLTGPARRPYGSDRGSKYQEQKGPTASRISKDRRIG